MTGLYTYTCSARCTPGYTTMCKKPTLLHTFPARMLTHLCLTLGSWRQEQGPVSHARYVSWPTDLFFLLHTHTHTRPYTLTDNPSCLTGQDISQVGACLSRICLCCCWTVCVCVCFECKFNFTSKWESVFIKDSHTRTHAQTVEAVVSLMWSPRSHHGDGRMKPRPVGEEVCLRARVSYRPRSSLVPQEGSYSPQANQRPKFETEFNSVGPTLLTFMTSPRGADSQQEWWHHSKSRVINQEMSKT